MEKQLKTPGPTQYDFAQLRQVRKKAAVSEQLCAVGSPGFLFGFFPIVIPNLFRNLMQNLKQVQVDGKMQHESNTPICLM